MRHLHLLVSDLFPPADFIALAGGTLSPGLRAIQARGESRTGPNDSLGTALGRLFGWPDPAALAPILLRAEGIDPGDAVWMRLDPVHLGFQHDRLYLTECVDLDAATAQALVDSLNAHFAADGLLCLAPQPQRWYLRLPSLPDMTTQALDAVAGRRIDPRLPRGADAARWIAFVNEAQMLLHEHPANQARETAGRPAINSVWPWGAGRWQAPPPAAPWRAVHATVFPAIALARAASVEVTPAPAGLAGLPIAEGARLLVSDALSAPARQGDPDGWRRGLAELDEHWLRPALAALRRGRLDRLVLEGTGDEARAISLTRRQAWRLWRRG